MNWDRETDVGIIGTGNGGLTAAVCLHALGVTDVTLVEKSNLVGGTSARSGGGVWVPMNRYARAAGAQDSREEALAYINSTVPPEQVPQELIEAYVDNAPAMVDFLHENSHVRYRSLEHYPDYYTSNPGGKDGHRSMEPEPLNRDVVDDWENVRDTHFMISLFKRIALSQVDAHYMSTKSKGWVSVLLKLLAGYAFDIPWVFKHRIGRRVACGGAGIVRLYWSVKERGIPVWRNTAFQELITDDAGKVIGFTAQQNGKTLRVHCRKGVILACGGFEKNQALRDKYLPKPTHADWSAGVDENTGDALLAGLKIGAATRLLNCENVGGWWCNTFSAPDEDIPRLAIIEKSLPGCCVVNMNGERIGNESQNYMAYQQRLYATHSEENPNAPAYMVFDARYRKNYIVGPIFNPQMRPDDKIPQSYFDSKFMGKADTVEGLANQLGIHAENLEKTVAQMNQYAKDGKDPDYGRGDTAYDRYYGDETVTPNPCLAPIDEAPFYAMRIDPGDFGTNGGLDTTVHAQVKKESGGVIDGLYAIGNCAAAILPTYPGPGATLGPAMAFGYLAAKHISSREARS